MNKYFKVLLITHLISIVIIFTTGALFMVGTFTVTEETKKVIQEIFNEQEKIFEELKARCDVQNSTHLYTKVVTTPFAQTSEISTTATTQQTLKYRFEVVKQRMYWNQARSYCQERSGDLIQHDQKVLTRRGRNKLSAEIRMLHNTNNNVYHTGIRRDLKNLNIFRRSSDDVAVKMEGWIPGRPYSGDGWDFVYWRFYNDSEKNSIYNSPDHSRYFTCEY